MSDQFLGSLRYFGFNFAPKGWAFANGQTLSIQQNPALFSLLGTSFGGDGVTTFQLPNMQSRAPVAFGQGLGLSNYDLGEKTGSETVTLLSTNLPAHIHTLSATTSDGTTQLPQTDYLLGKAVSGGGSMVPQIYAPLAGGDTTTNLAAAALAATGNNLPASIVQPYLTINCCIALIGVFPSRN